MKLSERHILSIIILVGEIIYVPAIAQHRHVHKHHHVHHHNTAPLNQNITNETEVTTQKSIDVGISNFFTEKVHRKRSNNNTTTEEGILYEEKPLMVNDTRNRDKKSKTPKKVIKKHSKKLSFRNDKVKLHVRQHAAKSVKLDCNVKGVSKKILVTKWLKNGVSIKNDLKRFPSKYSLLKKGQELLIENSSPSSDQGNYTCIITWRNQNIKRPFTVEIQERHRATKPYLNSILPGNHTILVNSNLTLLCEVIPPFDDTSPPEISWLRHHRDSWTNDESNFGKKGFDKEGRSRGFRLVDEYGIPKFDELQTCAINGNCRNRKVLDKPLEYSLTNVTETDEGWYSCKAENHFGAELTSGYITVVTEMPINSSKISKAQFPQTYAIIVGFSLVILMCFAACVYYIYRSQEKRRHRKEDIKIAQNINPVTKWVTIEQPRPTHAISDEPHPIQWPQVRIDKVNAQAVIHSHKHSHDSCKGSNGLCSFGEYAFDTDKEWELDRSKLIIGEILGEGEFGRVAGAILDNKTKVAVKMLKEGHTDSDVIDLVKEMSAMKQMVHDRHPHNHPNVIKMIGACTQPVGFPLLVVVEFAEFGNLKEYLLSKKPLPRPPRGILQQDIANTSTKGFYEIPVSANALSFPCSGRENYTSLDIKELLNMAWQVSKGMTYLSQRKFVHRDLAARNILVCSQNVYKIADFGMARPVEQKEYYRRTSNGKVPLKWMAPESMFEGVHTTQSDVWSYGILLWEIFSYGDSPYKGLGVDVLLEFLKQCISLTKNAKDYMMEQPPRMDNGIYHLMGECWNFDDALRPNWPKIEERTRKFYEDAQPRIYLEMDGAGTPSLKKGSSLSRRDRVGSTSSRITASSISTNATMLNPTMEETAPLIRSSSGSSSSMNKYSNEREFLASEIDMHKPVIKVDSGIERDFPPSGPWADFSNDHVFRHPARGYGNNTYSGRNHTCRIIDEAGDRSFIQDRRSHISCSIGSNNLDQPRTFTCNNTTPLGRTFVCDQHKIETQECEYTTILNDREDTSIQMW